MKAILSSSWRTRTRSVPKNHGASPATFIPKNHGVSPTKADPKNPGISLWEGWGLLLSQERPSPFPACLSRPQESHHSQLLPATRSSWPWVIGPPRPNLGPRVLPLWSSEADPRVPQSSCACREPGIGLLPSPPGLRPGGSLGSPLSPPQRPQRLGGLQASLTPCQSLRHLGLPLTGWVCHSLSGPQFPQQKNEAGHVAYQPHPFATGTSWVQNETFCEYLSQGLPGSSRLPRVRGMSPKGH